MLLKTRSYEKELLDSDTIARNDLYRNLEELHTINKFLGGYKASTNGIKKLLRSNIKLRNVLDVGFGGGDFIKQLDNATGNKLFFYGVDLKEDCVSYARNNLELIPNKMLICDDYRNINPELLKKVDLIHCSLFIHHLTEEEIVRFFSFAKEHNCAVLVNDLHRNWLAYYSIKVLTSLFSGSHLVKNDAPVSVKRAFKKQELISLAKRSGFEHVSVTWNWAFRYTLIAK
jgi:2-polyprenyl-3-methyl-5-hydroxy-6-metoxy-1,4-benzoquinol methylase